MQNQETVETMRLTKQEYNRLYYQKHRDRLLAKKKASSMGNILQLFTKSTHETEGVTSLSIHEIFSRIEFAALIILVGLMTYFLIGEASKFYLDAQESHLSAYLKASIIEGISILFSLTRSRSAFVTWIQRAVVILLCSFTLWLMSGTLVKTATGDSAQTNAVAQTIRDLETEQTRKESLRDGFIKRGLLHSARRYEKVLDALQERIISQRHNLASLQSPTVIANNLGIMIAFRLLIVVANLLCVHRISELVGSIFNCQRNQGTLEVLNSS